MRCGIGLVGDKRKIYCSARCRYAAWRGRLREQGPVTPLMIDAALEVLARWSPNDDQEETRQMIADIYAAMHLARRAPR